MNSTPPIVPPIRPMTCLLAEMQTSINAAGLRFLEGDIERFGIFTLIVREAMLGTERRKPISMHSLSISLSRPFETVRRHVGALIAMGICERVAGGIVAHPDTASVPQIAGLLALSHDCFVRFVDDLDGHGMVSAVERAARPYRMEIGIQSAIDVMLGTAESNAATHGDWLELVIFSTVLCANVRRFSALPAPATTGPSPPPLDGHHAIRASVVGRALNLPGSTIRRRIAAMTRDDGPLIRLREGLVVSQGWLDRPEAMAASQASIANVRRVLLRAAAAGFPLHAIETAYVQGRPPPADLG